MSNAKQTWEDVREKIEGLGLKLKYHLEAERAEHDETPPADTGDSTSSEPAASEPVASKTAAADTGDEASIPAEPDVVDAGDGANESAASADTSDGLANDVAETAKKEFSAFLSGVEKFVDMIDDAFDSLGAATRDEAVRSNLRDIGEKLRNAMAATWKDAGDDLRDILTRPKRSSDDDPLIGEIIDPDAPGDTD